VVAVFDRPANLFALDQALEKLATSWLRDQLRGDA
jgi:hypothetical protein